MSTCLICGKNENTEDVCLTCGGLFEDFTEWCCTCERDKTDFSNFEYYCGIWCGTDAELQYVKDTTYQLKAWKWYYNNI